MEQAIIEAIRISMLLISWAVLFYAVLSGVAKVVKNLTLARRIEQNIINQIEDMVKAKMEKEAKA